MSKFLRCWSACFILQIRNLIIDIFKKKKIELLFYCIDIHSSSQYMLLFLFKRYFFFLAVNTNEFKVIFVKESFQPNNLSC
jgi:hypothetical protein